MPVPTPLTPTTAGPTDSTTLITACEYASRSWTSEGIWSVVPSAGGLKQLPMMGGVEPPEFTKRIIDFNRLLEGENRANYTADDITHWRVVYTDLVRFKEQLLSQTREHIQ